MFDTLLLFVRNNLISLIDIYIKESEKEDKILSIIKEKNSADVRLHTFENIPYEENIKKELLEKKEFIRCINEQDSKLELKDKWIVTMPPIDEVNSKKLENFPTVYMILINENDKVVFVGVPSGNEEITYTFFAENDYLLRAKNNWELELTVMGQKYLGMCQMASRNSLNYFVFRSIKDFCDINSKINLEECQKIFEMIKSSRSADNILKYSDELENVGSPILYNFYNKKLSLETIRHMLTVYELKNYFGRMKDWKICEIGGSYGNLFYLMSKCINFSSYDFIEIEYLVDLAQIFADNLKVNNKINFIKCRDIVEYFKYDLFISEYCYEELIDYEKYKKFLLNSSNALFVVSELKDKFKTFLEKYFKIEVKIIFSQTFVFCKKYT